jgi:hypothetical protein
MTKLVHIRSQIKKGHNVTFDKKMDRFGCKLDRDDLSSQIRVHWGENMVIGTRGANVKVFFPNITHDTCYFYVSL